MPKSAPSVKAPLSSCLTARPCSLKCCDFIFFFLPLWFIWSIKGEERRVRKVRRSLLGQRLRKCHGEVLFSYVDYLLISISKMPRKSFCWEILGKVEVG